MHDLFRDIQEFHEKFELEYSGPPRHLDPSTLGHFRTKFMAEELGEYVTPLKSSQDEFIFRMEQMLLRQHGLTPQSLEKQFDALIDLVYVAVGTAYLQGFDFNEGWRRVHAANMAKVRARLAVESARGSTYDVVKPQGWTPPDLSDLVAPDWPPTMSATNLADGFKAFGSTGQPFEVRAGQWVRSRISDLSPVEKATMTPERGPWEGLDPECIPGN
jgi:hypothetical protein